MKELGTHVGSCLITRVLFHFEFFCPVCLIMGTEITGDVSLHLNTRCDAVLCCKSSCFFSEDFESQILGKFITKNTTFLPCSKADFNSEDNEDRWICEEIQIHLLSGDC